MATRLGKRNRQLGILVKLYLLIAAGGALGTIARYALSSFIAGTFGDVFPWGTLIVNISGCFLIGFFAALTGPDGRVAASPDFRQFVMVGICGGYTTFSSFSLQTLNLLRGGDLLRGGGNIGLSVGACMLGVWLGAVAAAALNQTTGRMFG
jgi:fluoride exporter